MPRRPTHADIARRAGVSRAAVSLAFRNNPSIPEATRKRFLKIAEQIGYKPDPMLSALASYRLRSRKKAFQATIGWVENNVLGYSPRRTSQFSDIYRGVVARAQAHGFKVDVFNLQQPGLSAKRLASILRARNIRGFILPPQPLPNMELDLEWDDFAVINSGYTLAKPRLHTVSGTQYRAMAEVMHQVEVRNYRRIGFVINAVHDARVDHNYLSGYLSHQYLLHGSIPIPPAPRFTERKPFLAWFRRHRPDALVSGDKEILDFLEDMGISVPGQIGVASPTVTDEKGILAGNYENSFHMGEVAVDQLAAMMQRGERGIPQHPQRVNIEGRWITGKTLPIRKP